MKRALFPLVLLTLVWSASCSKGPLHKDPETAIKRCLQGIDELGKGGMAADTKSVALAAACKDLYVEVDCGKAFENAGAVPPQKRAMAIAEVCRKVYCPKLKDPKPEICGLAGLPNSPMRLLPLWHELQWAILARDLGPDNASRLYARLVFTRLATQPIIMHTPMKIELPKAKTKMEPPD